MVKAISLKEQQAQGAQMVPTNPTAGDRDNVNVGQIDSHIPMNRRTKVEVRQGRKSSGVFQIIKH